jgi:hypothetical protein
MDKQQFLKRLDQAWGAFEAAGAGVSDAQLVAPGVAGDWSVKDLLAHVTTWEEEALKYLPLILAGGRPPRYATQYGGLDAFNAQVSEQKRRLSLAEVQAQRAATHQRLLDYLATVPAESFASETRFRRRLRIETYSHYTLHANMIRAWREGTAAQRRAEIAHPIQESA